MDCLLIFVFFLSPIAFRLSPSMARADPRSRAAQAPGFGDRIQLPQGRSDRDGTFAFVLLPTPSPVDSVTIRLSEPMYEFAGAPKGPRGWVPEKAPETDREWILKSHGQPVGTFEVKVKKRKLDPDDGDYREYSIAKERRIRQYTDLEIKARWKELGMDNYEIIIEAHKWDKSVMRQVIEVEVP